jgi:uncharacterized protein involved in cysteine biosynthesis
MINALILSLGQLFDRRIMLLLAKILGVTFVLLGILGTGLYYLLTWGMTQVLPNDGGFAAAAAAALISIIAAVFLFRVVAIFVINIFSDEVVDAVETKHYPARAEQAKPPSYRLGLQMGVASAGRALGYNILATPIYIMLLVTAIGPAIAFFAINAILIGRDLQDMVASRHVVMAGPLPPEWQLSKANRFFLGLIIALLMVIPFVNFLAPILGAAMATHLVHNKFEEGLEH